jgi:two-component system sensor histidine kinase KdpD
LWQGIIIDISDQMRIEELESALEREREAVVMLQALDEMKNGFLQAVSHELRTPLTSIKGLGATLEHHLPSLPFEDVADLIKRINVNARKLEDLLADLLDVDRLSRGIFLPQLTTVDVGSIVAHAAELVDVPSQRVFVDCDPVKVVTDGSKVARIAENLISNAIKHTPSDATIWITVKEDAGAVLISVEDSGTGISNHMKESIFEPFAQGHSENSHSQGLGLGLSLVRQFVELLGGQTWVEDRPEGGASFKVRLPLEAPVPAHAGFPPTT